MNGRPTSRSYAHAKPLWIPILCALTPAASAATYYVDSSSGSDASNGLSQGSAWQSVSRVNGAGLSPGDKVLFRRGRIFSGRLEASEHGSSGQPITFGAWGSGAAPVLYELLLRGDHLVVEDVVIDHQKDDGDAVRIRDGRHVTLRRVTLKNGTGDAIDADGADGLLVDTVEIHHFLAGSVGSKEDAHGVVVTDTDGVTIRNANIHHVSGDSFQADPNRQVGSITGNILIEDSELWTGPLERDFNTGWRAGDSPGENAVDTKVLKTGFESEARMSITLRNVVAHGWQRGAATNNRAAFNLKEKINAKLDRVTVYDCEIGFRVRGGLGNANTLILNAVIFDVEVAVRAEDSLTNLRVYNSTFGNNIGEMLRFAGGPFDTASWDWRNNAFVGELPSIADRASNHPASAADFRDLTNHDYHLVEGSVLVDEGQDISAVDVDRDGNARTGAYDVGAYEFAPGSVPKPPQLLSPQ